MSILWRSWLTFSVVMATVLLAFEVLVLTLGRSLTAPLDRLQHLVTLQAAGDFSKRLAVGAGKTPSFASRPCRRSTR